MFSPFGSKDRTLPSHPARRWRLLLAAALLVLVGVAAARTLTGSRAPALRPALSGDRRFLDLPGSLRVAYSADPRGTGRPLVLTSSVNAAASAYEMKPPWDAYTGARPLYALEWPGFGSSDHPDVRYTPELMSSALTALVSRIGTDVDVVALSLGSEFAARAALGEPRIRTLALISPSGLGSARGGPQEAGAEDGGERLSRRLRAVGAPLYALLRTRLGIELFLARSFRGPVDGGLVEYALEKTRPPGARNAPLYPIGGQLFTPDAYRDLYSRLTVPTLVLHDRDGFVSFDRLPEFASRPGVRAVRIPGTDGLPHFERLPEVRTALDAFWRENR